MAARGSHLGGTHGLHLVALEDQRQILGGRQHLTYEKKHSFASRNIAKPWAWPSAFREFFATAPAIHLCFQRSFRERTCRTSGSHHSGSIPPADQAREVREAALVSLREQTNRHKP